MSTVPHRPAPAALRQRPLELRLERRICRTHLPFRFGIATLTEAPMLFAEVVVRTPGGGRASGFAAELLVPKWFAKDPNTSLEDDRTDLEDAARAAFAHVKAAGEATVFGHWLGAQNALVEADPPGGPAPLVRMFGVALVERALIDAACRTAGLSFPEALDADLLGLSAIAEVDPALDGWTAERLGTPLASTRMRHTVGLADDLDASDLETDHGPRVDDHPRTLAEDIERYAPTAFKIKVSGDAEADLARLERIAALLPVGALVTLDGNEQYADARGLADLLDALEQRGAAAGLLGGLVSIEQPLHRARSFAPDARDGLARLTERAPVIIDEADARLDDFPRALALGYGGVSMKACKGVLRALCNRARIDVGGTGFQSAEDLTNLPTLPLLQDLAVVGALGLEHVERNGHHYFAGAPHLTDAERAHLVHHHADLFDADARLVIERGALALGSVHRAPGFGYAGPVAMESTP